MAHKIEEIVKQGVLQVAEQLGYELVDVEYRKREETPYVTVFIYKEGGVDLDDCEKMHNAIDPVLDELDPTSGSPYTLNVSSPGLDRAFKYPRDFERNIGNDVEIKFFAPYDGKKRTEGKLLEYNESNISVLCEGKEIKIRLDKIAKIHLAIRF